MTATEQNLKHFGVAADEKWKARVGKEKLLASSWPIKWNWILDEYSAMAQQLEELKKERPAQGRIKPIETRTCMPLPDTSSRVIGWLTHRADFQLEVYGPYMKKYPILPAPIA